MWLVVSVAQTHKTYLQTSMLQERRVGLSTLSIEHEIARDIELMELISTFTEAKAIHV